MKHLIIFVFLTLSLVTISCGVKLNKLKHNVNHYNVRLNIFPENRYLEVKGKLIYISPEPLCDSAIFYLHKQFNIKSVSGKDVAGYKFYTSPDSSLITNPDARILHIYFNRMLNKGEQSELEFEYSGEISEIHNLSQNTVTKEWTEIGFDLPWYPYNKRHGEFTFDLQVNCTNGYIVGASGQFINNDTAYDFKSENPVNDITVIISKKLKEINTEGKDFNISLYYSDISDSAAKDINNNLNWIMRELTNRFGEDGGKNLTVLQSMRDIGGSYSNLGMISLSQLYDSTYNDNSIKYFMRLSHGAAKLWWWQAAHDWNDWMNEGFAEFSALLLVKEKFGENIFRKILIEKEDSLAGLPPVWMFNREHLYDKKLFTDANKIMNVKIPVLLFHLYKKIGSENFYKLCREMITNDVSSTIIFLRLLEQREGRVTTEWFEDRLRNF